MQSAESAGSRPAPSGSTWHAWWGREVDRLRQERPRIFGWSRSVATRPDWIVVSACTVLGAVTQSAAQGGDTALFLHSGSELLGPHPWDVFSVAGVQVGPLYLGLLAVVHVLASLTHIPPFVLTGALLGGVLASLTLRTFRFLRPGPGPGRVVGVWLLAYCLVVAGFLAEPMLNGHPEELITALLLVRAAEGVRRGETWWPALLVGVAGELKMWGFLGLPLLVHPFRLPLVARRAAVVAALLATTYLPFAVFGTVRTFQFQWGTEPASVLGYLTGYAGPYTWELRALQAAVAGLAVWLLVRRPIPAAWVVAALIGARLALDPIDQNYYWTALALVLAVAVLAQQERVSSSVAAGILLLAPASALLPYLIRGSWLTLVHIGWLSAVFVVVVVKTSTSRRRASDGGMSPLASAVDATRC